jgi:hypothetical protein
MEINSKTQLPKSSTFEVFRYQLVVDKTLQMDMFQQYQTAEEVRADKNNIFHKIISADRFNFFSSKSEITSKLLYQKDTMYYFKIGVKRNARVYMKDFSEATIENYPNIIVAINNNPNVQKIAIQDNTIAFRDCKTVSHFIQDTIDVKLKSYNLSMMSEPLFDKKEFWNLVRKYPKQIRQLTFDLVSPNMANISKNLDLNLKQLYEDTNTHKTKVELNADEESYLEIKESSKFINSLVDYSADGGGNIQMRIAGMRKKLHTAETPTEFSVDEMLLKNDDWNKIDEYFKEILI